MPTPTRRIARRLTALGLAVGLAAVLVSTAIASGAQAPSWDLAVDGAPWGTAPVIGTPPGIAIDVDATTSVSAVGIEAAFSSDATLAVEVRDITGLSSVDAVDARVVARATASVNKGAMSFHDVPLAYDFDQGKR